MDRRLSVILSSDVAGYSRAMGADEAGTLAALKQHRREVFGPVARKYGGRTVKLMGDGALMEFGSVTEAVAFAVETQCALARLNGGLPEDRQLRHRIGINLGDVIAEGDDIYGDGVNIAARLQALADPGGICISRSVYTQVHSKLDLAFEDLGPQSVKNIADPVPAYRVRMDERAARLSLQAAEGRPAPKRRIGWLALPAAAIVAAVAAAGWWQSREPELEPLDAAAMVLPLPDKPSIAVLALDDLSSGEDRGYLSDAIAEGVITELSSFSEFLVIARNSSFKYRGTAVDVRQVARELGVHYVLEGSLQKNGTRLRVTVQLIDALAGTHIWAETYDRELEDLFAVQDEIVRAVAGAVGGKVAFHPPPSGGVNAVSALNLNLRARPHLREFTREGTRKALELNLAAVEADPQSPFGYIGLAFVYQRAEYGWLEMTGEEGLALAEQAADKAIALDPNNYDAHFARGYAHLRRGEQDLAIQRYRRALELNPNAANVMGSLAESLMYTGQSEEAYALMHKAVRLDPHHPDWFKWNLAWMQWARGDCPAALETMNAMAKMPVRARRMLAVIHICLGQQEAAEEALAVFLESEPDASASAMRANDSKRYSDMSILDRYLEGLVQAGLPE